MRMLVRTLGSPVPQEVRCTAGQCVGELLAALATGNDEEEGHQDRHKLVYRGRVLHDPAAKLCDVVADGDVLVLLPRRSVAARPPPPEPSRGPTLREINAAIRDDLAAQGPGRLEAAEAAARREGQAGSGGAAGLGAGLPDVQALEQALMSGEMGALRAYLDQLQEALRGAEGLAAAGGGGGGGAAAGDGEPSLAAALDLMFGMAGAAGGQGAGQQHGEEEGGTDEDDEDEEDEEEGSDEGTEDFEEEEEYTDEEEEDEEEDEEEGASEEEEEHGGQLAPPQGPDPDSRLLAELMEMGFPESLCRNALLMGRNRFEPALEWLLEHAEDPAATQPLSDAQLARLYGRGPRRAGPPVNQGALAMLQDMGFDRQQAEQALRTFNNNLNAATSWLLNLGALAAAAPQPAGGGGQAAAGGEQAHEEGQPAAGEPQQAESGEDSEEDSEGTQSVHSSSASGSDAEDSEPEGADQVPGLASENCSSSGSSEDEEARAQQPAGQAQQAVARQPGEDGPPGLDSGSDSRSSYEGSGGASEEEAGQDPTAMGARGAVQL